jgi:bile acid:Na+ symporter, BASS family
MYAVDQIHLNFNPEALQALNVILGIVMFGVALDLRVADFQRVLRAPLAPGIGLMCQFVLLPVIASLLVLALKPAPSMALGILLVAACPGGNVSNFFTSLGQGNAALSVSMSAISTLVSIVMTPFNFMFWGKLNPHTAEMLRSIQLEPADILMTVLTILVIPTLLGMLTAHYKPALAHRLLKPMQKLSIVFMLVFILGALAANFGYFLQYVGATFFIVFAVNGSGLLLGYWVSRLSRLTVRDARAVCFETGIQNSAFGLLLIFNFFGGLGGMALVAAWWGVWHLISGLTLALWWSRRPTVLATSSP